jgi:hypothetical protein
VAEDVADVWERITVSTSRAGHTMLNPLTFGLRLRLRLHVQGEKLSLEKSDVEIQN